MSTTDQRIAKSTITIDILKQINTNCNVFDMILYVMSGDSSIMIERPQTGEVFHVPGYKIGEYIKVEKIKTNWIKHIDGSYSRFDHDHHQHLVPLGNEFGFFQVSIARNIGKTNMRFLRPFKDKHFELKVGKVIRQKEFSFFLKANLPVWPLWALVTTRFNKNDLVSIDKVFTLSKVYMKIGEEFYRFPYGNVNGNDGVCLGGGNRSQFKNIEQIWINWITTTFNFDYKHNLKSNLFFSEDSKKKTKVNNVIPITYDLEHINMMVHYGRNDKLNIVDFLYYLSHIEEVDHIDFSKIFFKHPGIPEKIYEN